MPSADVPSSNAERRPLTEDQINAPSKQAVIMLSVICMTTLICWAAGRAACNYYVNGESLTPRKTSLQDRIGSFKGVSVELSQALSGGDFEAAKKMVRGDAAAVVEKEKAACSDCAARKAAAPKIMSVGRVIRSNSVDAIVEVKTIGAPGGEVTRVFGVEREQRDYIVTRVYPSLDQAELKEDPSAEPVPTPDQAGTGGGAASPDATGTGGGTASPDAAPSQPLAP